MLIFNKESLFIKFLSFVLIFGMGTQDVLAGFRALKPS